MISPLFWRRFISPDPEAKIHEMEKILLAMLIFFGSNEASKINILTPMETCRLITDPLEILDELATLGLRREDLLEVAETMVNARRNTTANHPRTAGGYYSWSEGTARTREILIPQGWERFEEKGVQMVRKGNIRIGVCNMDAGVGRAECIPQNRSRKGEGTSRLVVNNQPYLFDFTDIPELEDSDNLTFLLCVYCDDEEYRAELSCPVNIENGYVTAYSKRIVLVGPGDGSTPQAPESMPKGGSDFEITVIRKQA